MPISLPGLAYLNREVKTLVALFSKKRLWRRLYSFETVLLLKLVTQILAPSKAMPTGADPALKVPSNLPSLARSLVTLLLPAFATQMLAPSKATP